MSIPACCRSVALLCISPLLAALSWSQTSLAPGSAHFVVYQQDKPVGDGDCTVQPNPDGYTITSHGKLNLTKFSYSFTNTQHLDGSLNLINNQLSGLVNGSVVNFSASSDSSGRQFQIVVSANDKQTMNTVDRHQHLVLLPDLDPAAYLLLTRVAMDKPPTSWILIPKQDGILVPSTITIGSGVHGNLNGSQIDVQHATITVSSENSIDVDLFYTPDGQVQEADLPQQNFSVVRDGFKLLEHPKPAVKPAPAQSSLKPKPAPTKYPAPQGGYPQTLEQ